MTQKNRQDWKAVEDRIKSTKDEMQRHYNTLDEEKRQMENKFVEQK